jgi:transposase-like protein
MGVFPSRDALAAKLFIEDVLKCCGGRPKSVVDAPWLRSVLESWVSDAAWSPFGGRNLIESAFIFQAEG